jgi:PAS domain S-box-containing protein
MASAIVVPLAARGRTLGAVMLVSSDQKHLYSEDDLDFVEDLARRAAISVDNAQLYGRSRELVALLDALYASAPVGLAFFDRDLRYRRVNELLAEINGLAVSDHIGRTVPEVLPGLDPVAVENLRRTLETGEPAEIEVEGETPAKPGVRRILDAIYYPVRAADGELLGVGAVVQEVTERRQAERALRMLAEAGRFLGSSLDAQAMLQSLADLVVPQLADWVNVHLVDQDGALERVASAARDDELRAVTDELAARWPAAMEQETGPGAIVRTGELGISNDVRDDDLVRVAQNDEHLQLLRRRGLRSFVSVAMRARERTIGVITFASQTAGRYGEENVSLATALAGRAALATDNALLFRELGQRAQSALALAFVGDGVFLVDESGVVRLWNTAASVITGLAASAIVGRPAEEAIPGWVALAERAPVAKAPEVPRAETIPIELHGGERWLSISGVGFPGGTVYAFRDLTDEQRVERLKTEFVSTISHELRTPLAAIYGAALTLLRNEPALEPQREGLLDVIAVEADRLARIVNDILWASRLESGTLHVAVESCDAKQLVSTVIDAARAHLPPKIDLRVDVARRLPPVAADPDKVRQVLTNLVDNAIKYSPDGGTVRVNVRANGSRVVFTVRDDGLGIPLAEQDRIFDKFYRLDPELTRGIGGTGLGLYITRELVRRMGGQVDVESAEGAGSTFTVELPAATA